MMHGNKVLLVTGAAGFIGFHVSRRLLEKGARVVGLDNLNPYYDVDLKRARLRLLEGFERFRFYEGDLRDFESLRSLFEEHKPRILCHLAAQAGVRHSLTDPFSYEQSNLAGFLNLLELARRQGVENLVYASSSSVYGVNNRIPFSVKDRADAPLSLYAATKRANELMAHAYSRLFGIPCTGLRYFTVYGPWGRPDMALFLFTRAILQGESIRVYNYGRMKRDFTYIDDIVDGTMAALVRSVPYDLFNLGNAEPVRLMDFIGILEEELGIEARKEFLPLQPGDVEETSADIETSRELLGFFPKTPLREGIRRFVEWYREYYRK